MKSEFLLLALAAAGQPPVAVSPARPILPLASYFTADDYPAAAIRADRQGPVSLLLTVTADGRASGCKLVRSSGSPALDDASCSILRRRARFHPALDRQGRPVAGTYNFTVQWRLPRPVMVTLEPGQPPVAVVDSPPPIVAVPVSPSFPVLGQPIDASGPPPPAPIIVRPPQPRGSPASLVTPDDYPASARARREQGRVEFRLTVGPNGRVTGCAITRSSGSSALDSATCMIMRRRARFTPAVDSNGQPAVGTVEQQLEWRLP